MLNSILVILCLIAVSAFFSISEISLAASRKIKLKLLADEGNINATRILKMQENPGMFFTVVQIGLNAVAILGGIVGDAAFSPAFYSLFVKYMSVELAEQLSFILSFSLVTGLFILFADLTPKRIGMIAPEAVALRIINPMRFCLYVFRPLVWFFNGLANVIFRIFKLPMVRKDDITSDDIYAVVEAGALAGVLRKQEHELIENVFELEFESNDENAPLSAILIKGAPFEGPIVYTGPLDELFLSRFGRLPYRSLDFVYETHDVEHVLPCGTVNFTVTEDYTRITEFKYLTGQVSDKTTIMKEYSHSYDDPKKQIPYYAIINDENAAHYERYRALTTSLPNFHPLGRLAEYRYYNMDVIIGRALALADELVG